MDELDWRILCELRTTSSITRTAERLNLTQSALSKRVRHIEESLNVRVVIRHSRGITFTPEGEYLADQARAIVERFGEVRENLLRLGTGEAGRIRLAMTNGFARSTLPPVLKDYKLQNLRVEFDISTGISADIAEQVRNYSVHVGFIWGEVDGEFGRTLLAVEQACVVHKDPVCLDDLLRMPQISYLKDPFSRRLLDGWWRDRFPEPPLIGMHANHGDTCREMVAAGLGYAIFLSRAFIPDDTALFRLPLTYRDGTPLVRRSWMIWRREFSDIPLVQNFLRYAERRLIAPSLHPAPAGRGGRGSPTPRPSDDMR